jgi:hypothetical protein
MSYEITDNIDTVTGELISQDITINDNTYNYTKIYEIDSNTNNIINDTINSI